MDSDPRVSIAVREARRFRQRVVRDFFISQTVMLIILVSMVYFGVELKWIVIVSICLTVGARRT